MLCPMSTAPRTRTVPHADSPQLVTRLLEMIARGVRTPRGLQETLGIPPHTARAYARAAEWLGLLTTVDDPWLTPLGIEYVYAGSDRPAVYTRAVHATPFVQDLIGAHPTRPPTAEEIAAAIAREEPDLDPATIERRARSIEALIGPALDPAAAPFARGAQLSLPLDPTTPSPPVPILDLGAGRSYNPDVYRYLLGVLLDHGELRLGHLRALLDRAGADEAPIGGYVDLALSRGDVRRQGERLVVTAEAVRHRDLVETTPSVILSDPAWRGWLDDLLAAARDRRAQIRRDQAGGRYARWDRRLFGRPPTPATLTRDLDRVLMERSLESFPVRGPTGAEPRTVEAPFLECWEQDGLVLALPPPLVLLRTGLGPLNEALLEARRQGIDAVVLPGLAHRPATVHGGVIHPGEPLPRSIPDLRSLRLRLLSRSPWPTLVAATLLAHRLDPGALAVVERRGRWTVRVHDRPRGELLPLLDAFATQRGWLACRRRQGGIDAADLLALLEALGIALVVARRAVLCEPFFGQLRREPEEMELFAGLEPLAGALADFLHQARP